MIGKDLIDVRSDTVTKPTQKMREAMAAAEVGDDGYGDDPTVRRLEAAGAEMLGKEAALFVPSGVFGNECALFTWCQRGTEVILGEECHIIQHEAGAAAVIAGVQTRPVIAPNGRLPPEALRSRLRRASLQYPATSLLCLENAHSLGEAVPPAAITAAADAAHEAGVPVHLDGARIFNAAAALRATAANLAAPADSVMFCLSKGLGAPVGSLLAGTKDFIAAARRKRQVMGGGLRQAGILAAAGLVALAEQTGRLAEDHERARALEEALARIAGVKVKRPEIGINMVFFVCQAARGADSSRYTEAFKSRGILINPPEEGVFRFVTHFGIDDAALEAVIKAAQEVFGAE